MERRYDDRSGWQGQNGSDRPQQGRQGGERDPRRFDDFEPGRPNPRSEYAGLGAGFGMGGFTRDEWTPERRDGEPRGERWNADRHEDFRGGEGRHEGRQEARTEGRNDARHEGRSEGRNFDRSDRDERFRYQPPPGGRDDQSRFGREAHDERFRYQPPTPGRYDGGFEDHPLRYREEHQQSFEQQGRGFEDRPLRYRDDHQDWQQRGGHGQQQRGPRHGTQQYAYSPSGEFGSSGHHGVAGASFGPMGRAGAHEPWQEQHRPEQSFVGQPQQREQHRPDQERGGWWQREPLCASEIMTREVKTVTRSTPVRELAVIMRNENVGAVPVVDEGGKPVGIVTDRDIVVRGMMGEKTTGELRTEDVMTEDVEAVKLDDSVHEVIELMGRKQVRRIPVVDNDGRLCGIVSLGDVASRADYDEELQGALERISSKRSFWSRLWR